MPTPPASQIESMATAALSAAGIQGEGAEGLARALAQTAAEALSMFLSQAQILPGIPAAADPLTGSGSTVGPGTLLPPPAGGPSLSQIEAIANTALAQEGIQGKNAGDLASVIAGALEQGISLFTAQVQVAPGIPIAGFMTAAPGRLI